METMEGVVSHLQNTVSVSGGGDGHQASTTYIALFRLDGQPVQFRCGQPIAIAEGDQLRVAGRRRAADLLAYACLNMTTRAVLNAGFWGSIVLAALVAIVGLFGCFLLGAMLGQTLAILLGVAFTAGTIGLVYRALMISNAIQLVQRP